MKKVSVLTLVCLAFSLCVLAQKSAPCSFGVPAKLMINSGVNIKIFPDSPGAVYVNGGSAIKSKLVAEFLADLGVTKTYSRPYVSHDNPFSESQFRTMKYWPE